MLNISLPDGSVKQFEGAVTAHAVAESIGAGLAKAALAAKVDERMVDTSYLIEQDAQVEIVTAKSEDGLEVIRHSTAHLLAQAVKQLYPEAQVTIGPVIGNGFYYDFHYPKGFTPEDMEKIEARMHELVKQDHAVTRRDVPRDQASAYFRDLGEIYKAEIIEGLEEDVVGMYGQDDFTDLCRGPHVPSTGKLGVFKLTKLAGAYWRGDSDNEMLQRVYGTAWGSKKELDEYLARIAEAEKRDHRKVAKKMDLFHIQPDAPGMIFWHANGWTIVQQIRQYMRQYNIDYGYQEISTPQIADISLWERSGHFDKFGDEMFFTESEKRRYAVKPMNCPCHIQVFNQGLKSYRDLPLRLAEFGSCHRNEHSGTLHGLMRVRNFVQDDAHIFCTEAQIQSEVSAFIDQVDRIYSDFGFNDVRMILSTRPEKRVGSDEIWDKAEQALEKALNDKGVDWKLAPGEGAFYGPKVEFVFCDNIGREWTCGTIQVDFSMPERLGASYVAEDSSRRVPVMLHRAILGSLERFVGILLEQTAGALPLWLAPVQAVVAPISDKQADYAQQINDALLEAGLRPYLDLRNEKISFKIREHSIACVPYVLICGEREASGQTVTIRRRDGEDLGAHPLAEAVAMLKAEVAARNIETTEA